MIRALVTPTEALEAATIRPRPWGTALTLAVVLVVLGGLTLPKQLPALTTLLLGPGGPPHGAALRGGLGRLVVLDRVLPPVTPLLAALIAFQLAGAWFAPDPAVRRRLADVLALGLAPLVVLRLGELVTVWLVPFDAFRPGDVLTAPRLFATGPLLLVARGAGSALLDQLDARLNLVTLWIVGLWAVGFRRLEGAPWAAWHVMVPLVAFAVAGAVTWWLATPVLLVILHGL